MSGEAGRDDAGSGAGEGPEEGPPEGARRRRADEASGSGNASSRHRADETVRSESLPDSIRCPHCGEEESEQFAAFGSAVSVSQYWCRSCRTVFEAFKWR